MLRKLIFIIAIFLLLPLAAYAKMEMTGLKTSADANAPRIVFELSDKPRYKFFTLDNPNRLVIDFLDGAVWNNKTPLKINNSLITKIRHSYNKDKSLRIVFDISKPFKIQKSFILAKTKTTPDKFVFDIEPLAPKKSEKVAAKTHDTEKPAPKPQAKTTPKEDDEEDNSEIVAKLENMLQTAGIAAPLPITKDGVALGVPLPILKERRKPMVVIDAGHGGHDPGTIGAGGVQEKNITLAYAKELQKQLLEEGKYEVSMIRTRDVFVRLRERIRRARKANGDLFISIHVNSHPNKDTSGLSVYTLSETASDKEAEALAKAENKEDIISGLDFGDKENDVTALFIEMAQRNTKNLSASFAENIVTRMQDDIGLLRDPHRFAGFRVLTGADIPSVLVELGYITNNIEEKLLTSESYKNRLAKAMVEAIDSHFSNYPVD
jgi:N-acetylmuramoyl-L-alanine amidase